MLKEYASEEEIEAGWKYIRLTEQQLLQSLARHPSSEDMYYAGRAIDEYMKPRYPSLYQSSLEEDHLIVDPEDGTADTVEEELNSKYGLPGKVALTKPLSADHFRKVK